MKKLIPLLFVLTVIATVCCPPENHSNSGILGSWTDLKAKRDILSFVEKITDSTSADFVKPADRIATFDNDGTLLCEKPFWFGDYFVFDRIKKMAPSHPEWKDRQPWKAVLQNDRDYLVNIPSVQDDQLVGCAEEGLTTEELTADASKYYSAARHPALHHLVTGLSYLPMIELLRYLESKGFRNYIVTGGDAELVRSISLKNFGIPPERVIGAHFQYSFSDSSGHTDVKIHAENLVKNIRDQKADNIALIIGKRPVIAVGNSNGDLEMLEYTDDRPGPSLQILIHHDDPQREYSYDKGAEQALKIAAGRKWIVVSMKRDWQVMFPEKQ